MNPLEDEPFHETSFQLNLIKFNRYASPAFTLDPGWHCYCYYFLISNLIVIEKIDRAYYLRLFFEASMAIVLYSYKYKIATQCRYAKILIYYTVQLKSCYFYRLLDDSDFIRTKITTQHMPN